MSGRRRVSWGPNSRAVGVCTFAASHGSPASCRAAGMYGGGRCMGGWGGRRVGARSHLAGCVWLLLVRPLSAAVVRLAALLLLHHQARPSLNASRRVGSNNTSAHTTASRHAYLAWLRQHMRCSVHSPCRASLQAGAGTGSTSGGVIEQTNLPGIACHTRVLSCNVLLQPCKLPGVTCCLSLRRWCHVPGSHLQ